MVVLKTTQQKLLIALQSVAGIVERRNTMPVLANVLLRKNGVRIELTTSDLEIQLRTEAELGGDEGSFATTVEVRKLIDILRTMPAEQAVTLETRDDKLVLRSGRSRFTLQTLPAEDFPLVQEAPDFGQQFAIPQKTLKQLLDRVAFAMAVHDIRYYLNGVLFVAEGRELSLVATDGHRLAFCSATLDVDVPKQEVILPRKTVIELQRLLSVDGATEDGQAPAISLAFASNQARFDLGAVQFVTKLVEGQFPDYNRVIPKSYGSHITLGRAPLLASLQRTAILSNEKFRGVLLRFAPGALRIAANNAEQEEAVDELEIAYDGETLEMGFNVTYLIDVLANVNTEEMVTIALQDAASSMLVTMPDDAGFKYVVMPMRL